MRRYRYARSHAFNEHTGRFHGSDYAGWIALQASPATVEAWIRRELGFVPCEGPELLKLADKMTRFYANPRNAGKRFVYKA